MSKSNPSAAVRKPAKPRPDFQLFPHATGRWAKKIHQKLHYFGPTTGDPKGQAALERWLEQKDDLLAGRTPRAKTAGLTVADLCNHFLTFKRGLLASGEIVNRTFQEYFETCQRLVASFGKTRPIADVVGDDFQRLRNRIGRDWGPVRVGNEIQRIRSVFKYAYDAALIEHPVRFGPGFKKPSAKVLRQNRAKGGLRMFEREELLAALQHATTNAKAMLLLGVNAGMGNTDLAMLPTKAVNLKTGWLDHPRPKTGIPRHVPLWPETVKAIMAALDERRPPKDPAQSHLLFIGPRGESYIGSYRVHQEVARVLKWAKIERQGLSFYAARHTFQTVAEGVHDMAAVQSIMGHAPASGDMSAAYRERIDDARLVAVTEHVRRWLFSDAKPE